MRRLLILLNVLAPIALVLFWVSGFFWFGLAILFLVHMLSLVATLVPGCGWWGAVQTRTEEDGVWLTIDDGPDPEDTPAILKMLEAAGATATFFVIGEKAERWPELIRAISEAGHGIENHTLTHPQFSFWRAGSGRYGVRLLRRRRSSRRRRDGRRRCSGRRRGCGICLFIQH